MVAGVEYRHIRAWHETQTPDYSPALSADNVVQLARADGAPQDVYYYFSSDTPEAAELKTCGVGQVFNAGKRLWLRWDPDVLTIGERQIFYEIYGRMRPLAGIDTSEQVTEAAVFGSGCIEEYPWWRSARRVGWTCEAFPFDAPNGWVWSVTADDPDDEDKNMIVLVTHEKLMHAARRIVDGDAGDGVRISTEREAAMLIWSPDDADFDAGAADELLQVAVYGEVHYG